MVFLCRFAFMVLVSIVNSLSFSVAADIYKCEVAGKVVLQDVECDSGAIQSKVNVVIQNDRPEYNVFFHKKYDETRFSDWENKLIKAGKVGVGMSVEALEQSWGRPSDINRSAFGPEQWDFSAGRYDQRYAYVQDGKVVNWQD